MKQEYEQKPFVCSNCGPSDHKTEDCKGRAKATNLMTIVPETKNVKLQNKQKEKLDEGYPDPPTEMDRYRKAKQVLDGLVREKNTLPMGKPETKSVYV